MRDDLTEKISKSIERLKAFCPPEGYYLAFSGGKDSCVCKALLDMSGCKYDAHYRVTGIDPPELVRFIREFHPDVSFEVPMDDNGKPITMWNLIIVVYMMKDFIELVVLDVLCHRQAPDTRHLHGILSLKMLTLWRLIR